MKYIRNIFDIVSLFLRLFAAFNYYFVFLLSMRGCYYPKHVPFAQNTSDPLDL